MLVRRRWSMAMRLIAMIVGTFVMMGTLSACDPIAPNVVGKNLPDAIHRLEISGYKQVNVVDDSGMTITTDHYEDGYEVTAQDKEGTDIPTTDTITLTVAESHVAALVSTPSPTPEETTATPEPAPATVEPEPEPEPEPAVEEPEPEPVADEPAPPAPAPAPAPARPFTSCAQAREAGAAPLYRGDPGYSPRLDRDKDGVACE